MHLQVKTIPDDKRIGSKADDQNVNLPVNAESCTRLIIFILALSGNLQITTGNQA